MTDSKTVVEDLAAWLTAVWDEEEAMVQAAIDDDTGQDGGFEDEFDRLTKGRKIAGPLAFEPSFGEACARMIVHNTPRRALARIAADRKILKRCMAIWSEYEEGGSLCKLARAVDARLMMHDLASPYRDRPDFPGETLVERQGVER